MKKHRHFSQRTLLHFAVILGTVASGIASDITLPPDGASHPDKRPGLLKRIFSHKAERVEDDDDGDTRRKLHWFGQRKPRTTTVITTTTTTAPPSFEPQQPDNRNPNVQESARIILLPQSQRQPELQRMPPHLSSPSWPGLVHTEPLSRLPDSVVVVPPATQSSPVSRQVLQSPPLPITLDLSEAPPQHVQNTTRVVMVPATPQGPTASRRIPQPSTPSMTVSSQDAPSETLVLQPPIQPSPPAPKGAEPITLTTADVPQPTHDATSTEPSQRPQVPYGKPVPGRRGLVYPPGLKQTPENMIDVNEIAPGTKVRDPISKVVFLVP